MKSCKKGYYYCNTDKKCKPIPEGSVLRDDGFLMKETLDKKDKTFIKHLVKKLRGGSKTHAKQADDLEKAMNEEGLRAWFGKSSGTTKSGRKVKGWVQVGGKYDGKPCARQPGQKSTPKCVSSSKRRSMSDKERDSAARRKRAADPNQPQKSGAAKPTNVSTDPKRKMKENYFNRNKNVVDEAKVDSTKIFNVAGDRNVRRFGKEGQFNPDGSGPRGQDPSEKAKLAVKRGEEHKARRGVKTGANTYTPSGTMEGFIPEAKDKKGKGSGTQDACYHKVKSRYSVWPSAYASGALVKCRKVGAANWGNKTKN